MHSHKIKVGHLSLIVTVIGLLAIPVSAQVPEPLAPGITLNKEIGGGETQRYTVHLNRGEYIRLTAVQQGIDIVEKLIDPQGRLLVENDRYNGVSGPEALDFEVPSTGEYAVEIKAARPVFAPRAYTILVETRPTVRPPDRERIQAEDLERDARKLFGSKEQADKRLAIDKLVAARDLWRSNGDRYEEAMLTEKIGSYRYQISSYAEGLDDLTQAQSLWRSIENVSGECAAMNDIGHFYSGRKDYARAIEQYKLVGDYCLKAGNRYYAGWGAYNTANAYYSHLEDYPSAITYYKLAEPFLKEIGDLEYESECLNAAGVAMVQQKRYAEALPLYDAAFEIVRNTDAVIKKAYFLNNRGSAFDHLQDTKQALQFYEQALPFSREVLKRDPTATTALTTTLTGLLTDGVAPDLKERRAEWSAELEKIIASSGDSSARARTLDNLGGTLFSQDRFSEALKYHKQALALLPANDTSKFASVLLYHIGDDLISLEDFKDALIFHTRSLNSETDDAGRASSLEQIGECYYQLNKHALAIESYTKALRIHKDRNYAAGQVTSLRGLARSLVVTGDLDTAISHYKTALDLNKTATNWSEQVRILDGLGNIYYARSQISVALDSLRQALQIARDHGFWYEEATVLGDIGDAYSFQADQEDAKRNYLQALTMYRDHEGNDSEIATTLISLGALLETSNDYEGALKYYTDALNLSKSIDDETGLSSAYTSIADVYSALKDTDNAERFYSKALAIDEASRDKSAIAGSLLDLASIYKERLDYGKQLVYATRANRLTLELGDPDSQARALDLIGLAYNGMGEQVKGAVRIQYHHRAIDAYQRSIAIRHTLGQKGSEGIMLMNLAIVYYDLDDYAKASEYFRQSLAIHRERRDDGDIASTLYWLARMSRYQKHYKEAQAYIEEALARTENVRARLKDVDLRTSYSANIKTDYEMYIDCLMQRGLEERDQRLVRMAFEGSERSRARVLVELLEQSHTNISQGVDPDLIEHERALQTKLAHLAEAEFKTPEREREARGQIETDLGATRAELSALRAQIKNKSPGYAALTQPAALTVAEIQAQLLDPDTVLLEYSLGWPRSYAWLVGRDSIESFELPTRSVIEDLARKAHDALASAAASVPGRRKASRGSSEVDTGQGRSPTALDVLSKTILAPIAARLGNKRVIVVADGLLQYVPFSAMPDPRVSSGYQPMIISNEILSLPSASTLAEIRKDRRPQQYTRTMTVFADPVFSSRDALLRIAEGGPPVRGVRSIRVKQETLSDRLFSRAVRETGFRELPRLKGTLLEEESLRDMVKGTNTFRAYVGFEATRANAMVSENTSSRYVHFATHGLVNTMQPELSGIALSMVNEKGESQDGFLRLSDIYNLKMPADMVVLSACQTGLGKDVRGEGMIGLTRGFMFAGAERVVVSLWSVSDNGTAEFMKRFYKGVIENGKPPSAALRDAQISMFTDQQNKEYNRPYYWAPFILQGEWK